VRDSKSTTRVRRGVKPIGRLFSHFAPMPFKPAQHLHSGSGCDSLANSADDLGGMDSIALGCLTASASSRIPIVRIRIRVLGGLGTALILFILGLSSQAEAWGLGRSGLDMTILAIGSCMVIAAAAQARWKSPRIVIPLITLGRRSYEVYLLFDSDVCGVRAVWSIQGSRALTRCRATAVHRCHCHLRPLGRMGGALLFGADESPDSSAFRGRAREAWLCDTDRVRAPKGRPFGSIWGRMSPRPRSWLQCPVVAPKVWWNPLRCDIAH
jgi:hypothetical protein